jgi:dTDP-glucose 4,6-dehydratase
MGNAGYLDELPAEKRSAVEVIAGDLRDREAIHQATQGIDVLFHLGALAGIPYSYIHPREVIETNIMGTVNVLLAARDHGVGRLLYTSTGQVYGTANYMPIEEGHPLRAQSPYAASMAGAEKIVESFHASFGLATTVVRPFNIYGPRQSTRAVIPTIITQALAKDEIRLGNTEATRDFTYMEDAVSGFIMASESDAAIGQVFNIGSNSEISVGQIVEKVVRFVGRDVTLVREEKRMRPTKSEVQHMRAEDHFARELLGWSPQVGFDEGLERTIAWIAQNLGRYRVSDYVV